MSVTNQTNSKFSKNIFEAFFNSKAFPSSEIKLSAMSGFEIEEGTKESVFSHFDMKTRVNIELKDGFFPEPVVKSRLLDISTGQTKTCITSAQFLPYVPFGVPRPTISRFGTMGEKREYKKDGVLHRDVGPAVEIFFVNSKGEKFIAMQKWFIDGKLHRVNGPATIRFRCFENIDSQSERNFRRGIEEYVYYVNGVIQREDGPAEVSFIGNTSEEINIETGVISKTEVWYKDGEPHRIGAPASVKKIYNDAGSHVIYEAWYKDGELHRIGGPAETAHYTDVTKQNLENLRVEKLQGIRFIRFFVDGVSSNPRNS